MFAIGFICFIISYLITVFDLNSIYDEEEDIPDDEDEMDSMGVLAACLFFGGVLLMAWSASKLMWDFLP
jgi:hypothetical protein